MKKILLADADWVILNSQKSICRGSVLTANGKIEAVGPTEKVKKKISDFKEIEIIDCTGFIILPGLVNAHNHVYEIVERGLGKNYSLEDWLYKVIYPVNKMLNEEDYYNTAVLACADAFRNGTTTIVEQLTNFARFFSDAEVKAFLSCGIRARVARGVSTESIIDPEENRSSEEEFEAARAFVERWQGEELVKPWIGPAGIFTCDEQTLIRMKRLANDLRAGFHIHLSETRFQQDFARKHNYSGQVDWAYQLGLLDDMTSIAHAIWISDAEIDQIKASGACVVHNPSSNQILASGFADVPQWMEKDLRIALGTDGPASNDSMDMIAEMKACVLMHRVKSLDPKIISARDVFKIATEGGAAMLGLGDKLGKIAEGYFADIACVKVAGNPSLNPVYDPIDALVYYGSGRDVCLTMVNGKIVYREGNFLSLDIDRTLKHTKNIESRVRALGEKLNA
jgi:5-methylthioadenosine/S-adenosylhomocysteine deaminase